LLTGALLGAVLAATGLLRPAPAGLPPNVVASVDGAPISREEYLTYLRLAGEQRRDPVDAAFRRRVLDRAIDEKLLVSRGIALGLAHSDTGIAKAVSRAMIDTITADSATGSPDAAELARFYERNSALFTPRARLRLARMAFRGEDAGARADEAHARLAREPWDRVAARLSDPRITPLPARLIGARQLRSLLGRELAAAATALPVGAYSRPLSEQGGYSILWLQSLEPGRTPRLADIEEEVRAEYRLRAADNALRVYLRELRDAADIEIDEAFIAGLDAISGDAR